MGDATEREVEIVARAICPVFCELIDGGDTCITEDEIASGTHERCNPENCWAAQAARVAIAALDRARGGDNGK